MDVPFVFVINAGSGRQDAESVLAIIQREIPEERLGCLYIVRPGDDFNSALREAVEDCNRRQGILVAAGGDGTVNAVIARAMPLGLTLGIIPLGTFNYFARVHGIPVDPEAAVKALLEAEPAKLPVCTVNDEPFIVNVSLGLHTKIIAARERHTRMVRRNRLVAFFSAVITLLKEQSTLRAKLVLDGRRLQRRATMVMVSNNRLQLEALGLTPPDREGVMTVAVMHELKKRAIPGLLWRHLFGHLEDSDELEHFQVRHVDVMPARPVIRVVIDGELRDYRAPLQISLLTEAIVCLLPQEKEVSG